MKKIIITSLSFILISTFGFSFAQPVFAHGDEPRLEISVERVNPGGVVEVRGVGFEPEESITLALLGSEAEIPVAELTADMEGVFQQVVALPGDLAEGEFNFRAVTDHHQIFSATVLVQGSAIVNEEGGHGQREEDDGLLAPMPTYESGVSSTAVPQSTALETPTTQGSSDTWVYLVLAGFGMIAWVAMSLRRKSRKA